jgi:hypothetical protein
MRKKKTLKIQTFTNPENIGLYLETNQITRDDVLTVTESVKEIESTHAKIQQFTLFYWA